MSSHAFKRDSRCARAIDGDYLFISHFHAEIRKARVKFWLTWCGVWMTGDCQIQHTRL